MPETESVIGSDLVPAVVHEVVRLITPRPPEQVTAQLRLIQDLGFHSLALAELGFTLEDLFGLDAVTPERAMTLREVGDIVTLIEEAIADGSARPPLVADVEEFCGRYGVVWKPEP